MAGENCKEHSGLCARLDNIDKNIEIIRDEIKTLVTSMPSKETVQSQNDRINSISNRVWGALLTAIFTLAGWLFTVAYGMMKR
jgi:hypothetical protein